jgi:hypothetical protein
MSGGDETQDHLGKMQRYITSGGEGGGSYETIRTGRDALRDCRNPQQVQRYCERSDGVDG